MISWSFPRPCLGLQNPNAGSHTRGLMVGAYGLIQKTCLRGKPQGNPNLGDGESDELGGLTVHP